MGQRSHSDRRTPAIKLVTGKPQREDKEAKEDRKPKANTAREQAKAEREAKWTQIPINAERKKNFKIQRAAVEASKAEEKASRKGSKEHEDNLDTEADGAAKAAEEEGGNEDGEMIDTEL